MVILPSILDKTVSRPGQYGGSKRHLIPNANMHAFWESVYKKIHQSFIPYVPFDGAEKLVNPCFGNFGVRYHPTKHIVEYFHAGLDFDGKIKTGINPILDGILEYSGFGLVNGNYVMLSHPNVKTEDGFVLYSLYMHLRDIKVKFSSYQKMLREVSFHTYPKIPISHTSPIGTLGQTGGTGEYPHLHLQLEFRNEAGDIIIVDPAGILGIQHSDNLSKTVNGKEEFNVFCEKYNIKRGE